jgi:hypothetical protein
MVEFMGTPNGGDPRSNTPLTRQLTLQQSRKDLEEAEVPKVVSAGTWGGFPVSSPRVN